MIVKGRALLSSPFRPDLFPVVRDRCFRFLSLRPTADRPRYFSRLDAARARKARRRRTHTRRSEGIWGERVGAATGTP